MRFNKKRLREIVVKDIAENGLKLLKKRYSSWIDSPLVESLVKGRRIRDLPIHLAGEIDNHSSHYIRSKGFKTRVVYASYDHEDLEGTVRIKLFSEGHRHTWILIPRDIAEKIVVFGMIPDLP